MTAPIEVFVDAALCVGSGNCEFWAPAVFEVGEDGCAQVIGDPAIDPAAVRSAVEGCPSGAITIGLT